MRKMRVRCELNMLGCSTTRDVRCCELHLGLEPSVQMTKRSSTGMVMMDW